MGEVGFDEHTIQGHRGSVTVRRVYGDDEVIVGVGDAGSPEMIVVLDYDAFERLLGVLEGLRLPRCVRCNAPIRETVDDDLVCEDCADNEAWELELDR